MPALTDHTPGTIRITARSASGLVVGLAGYAWRAEPRTIDAPPTAVRDIWEGRSKLIITWPLGWVAPDGSTPSPAFPFAPGNTGYLAAEITLDTLAAAGTATPAAMTPAPAPQAPPAPPPPPPGLPPSLLPNPGKRPHPAPLQAPTITPPIVWNGALTCACPISRNNAAAELTAALAVLGHPGAMSLSALARAHNLQKGTLSRHRTGCMGLPPITGPGATGAAPSYDAAAAAAATTAKQAAAAAAAMATPPPNDTGQPSTQGPITAAATHASNTASSNATPDLGPTGTGHTDRADGTDGADQSVVGQRAPVASNGTHGQGPERANLGVDSVLPSAGGGDRSIGEIDDPANAAPGIVESDQGDSALVTPHTIIGFARATHVPVHGLVLPALSEEEDQRVTMLADILAVGQFRGWSTTSALVAKWKLSEVAMNRLVRFAVERVAAARGGDRVQTESSVAVARRIQASEQAAADDCDREARECRQRKEWTAAKHARNAAAQHRRDALAAESKVVAFSLAARQATKPGTAVQVNVNGATGQVTAGESGAVAAILKVLGLVCPPEMFASLAPALDEGLAVWEEGGDTALDQWGAMRQSLLAG